MGSSSEAEVTQLANAVSQPSHRTQSPVRDQPQAQPHQAQHHHHHPLPHQPQPADHTKTQTPDHAPPVKNPSRSPASRVHSAPQSVASSRSAQLTQAPSPPSQNACSKPLAPRSQPSARSSARHRPSPVTAQPRLHASPSRAPVSAPTTTNLLSFDAHRLGGRIAAKSFKLFGGLHQHTTW